MKELPPRTIVVLCGVSGSGLTTVLKPFGPPLTGDEIMEAAHCYSVAGAPVLPG